MLQCPACTATNPRDAKFCETCGTSLAELAASERRADEIEAEAMLLEVDKARSALAIVAGIQVFMGLLWLGVGKLGMVESAIVMAIGAVYFGLWAWAKSNPLAASIVGLALFVMLHGAEFLTDPSSLFRGILLKIFVVVVLGRAIAAGVKHREFVRERGLA